jgi:uncharacterized protein DUF262/uncharacterized protein DUF1524
MSRLRTEAMSLAELLARYDSYTVPDFQRVYGWGETEIQRLLSDLESAMRRETWLYLGTIYLANEPGQRKAQIADGQQRILTLTILYAAARDLEEDTAEADKLHALLVAPGARDGADAYRFAPRDLDAAFFRRWVLERGAARRHLTIGNGREEDDDAEPADRPRSESQSNIIGNRALIVKWLEALGPAGRRELFAFLAASSEVAVLSAANLDDARNAYASTHSRGLAQAEIDKLKAELLGDCEEDVRAGLAIQWEDGEARLGKERFAELFRHLIFIESERKPQHALEADLARVFGLPGNVQQFIEETLGPAVAAYERILTAGTTRRGLKRATPDGRRVRRIAGHLITLMRTSHDGWKGPAILALRTLPDKALEPLLRNLERLAAVLMIVGIDPSKTIERYAQVIHELKRGGTFKGSSLIIPADLLQRARELLGDGRFGTRERERFRMAALLKVNDLINGEAVAIDPQQVSCEHILPRNGSRTRWGSVFRDAARGYFGGDYANKLGNLAILTHRQNRDADTKPFDVKRKILRSSGYALSKDAAKERTWTAKEIDARTKRLYQMLVRHWRLGE